MGGLNRRFTVCNVLDNWSVLIVSTQNPTQNVQIASVQRIPNRFFSIWDFPCLKLGIRDFKAKSGKIRD